MQKPIYLLLILTLLLTACGPKEGNSPTPKETVSTTSSTIFPTANIFSTATLSPTMKPTASPTCQSSASVSGETGTPAPPGTLLRNNYSIQLPLILPTLLGVGSINILFVTITMR